MESGSDLGLDTPGLVIEAASFHLPFTSGWKLGGAVKRRLFLK